MVGRLFVRLPQLPGQVAEMPLTASVLHQLSAFTAVEQSCSYCPRVGEYESAAWNSVVPLSFGSSADGRLQWSLTAQRVERDCPDTRSGFHRLR
jgi:hypothetical protein